VKINNAYYRIGGKYINQWNHCISFSRPRPSLVNAICIWAKDIMEDKIDVTAIKYGECWFASEEDAAHFLMVWS